MAGLSPLIIYPHPPPFAGEAYRWAAAYGPVGDYGGGGVAVPGGGVDGAGLQDAQPGGERAGGNGEGGAEDVAENVGAVG